MPRLGGPVLVSGLDFYAEETTASHTIGARAYTDDGREFRYVKAGGTTLVAGNLLQSSAEDTQFDEMAVPTAVAIGATDIGVTLGSTLTTKDLFTGGFLVITSSTGIGQTFTILSNTAAAGAATCTFSVLEPVRVALTTSSKVTVRRNPYQQVIVFPTTSTGMPVGFASKAITAASFGWIASHGITAALSDATVTANDAQGLTYSAGTAGAVTAVVAANTEVARSLVVANVSAKTFPAFALLD